MNGNVKWRSQDKVNNQINSVVQKKDAYDAVINDYIYINDDQRSKLLMLREKSIENCKSFKKSCKNKNYDITVIDKSSDKIRQESETTLKRTKKLLSMIKGNKYSD